jgi:hypothetical protein
MASKKVSHPTWPGLSPLQRAVQARVQYDVYHTPGDSIEDVIINPKDAFAVDAQAEWRRAREEALAAGVTPAALRRAAFRMVGFRRNTVAVWTEIGGPISSGTPEQQARFRKAQRLAVIFAMQLGFSEEQGLLLSTMRPKR